MSEIMTRQEAAEIVRTFRNVMDTPITEHREILLGALDMAIEELEKDPTSVIYLCKYHRGDYMCKHTTRIEDALNFEKLQDGKYAEIERNDKVVAQINFDGEKMDEIVEQLRNEILSGALVLKDQRWIPISYRELTDEEREELDPAIRFKWTCPLPEDMEEVLITTKYGNVQLATFEVTEEGSFFDEMDEDDVVAWMPLPSPYKPEENEEDNT